MERLFVGFFTVEIGFHGGVVHFDGHFDQFFAVVVGFVEQISRDVDVIEFCAEVLAQPDDAFHLHNIDHALEFSFDTDGKVHDHGTSTEAVDNHVDATVEIRAHAIHLVDETDARNIVFVGLTPDGFRLGLDAGDGIKNTASTIEHAQAAFDFDGEVDVSRRIDNVNAVIVPEAGRGG